MCCLLLFSKKLQPLAHVLLALFSKTPLTVTMGASLVSSCKYHIPSHHGCFLRRSGSKTYHNYDISQIQWKLLFQKRQQQSHVSFWLPSRNHGSGKTRLFKSFASCTHECGCLCPFFHLRKHCRLFSWFCWSPLVIRRGI